MDKSKKNCRLGGEWPGLTKDKIVAVLPTRRLDVSSKDTFCITITTLEVYKNMSGRLYGFYSRFQHYFNYIAAASAPIHAFLDFFFTGDAYIIDSTPSMAAFSHDYPRILEYNLGNG